MMKNDGSRRSIRKNPRPNTSDPMSCLMMTRDAILMEIATLEAQNAEYLRSISIKNVEIVEVDQAISRLSHDLGK